MKALKYLFNYSWLVFVGVFLYYACAPSTKKEQNELSDQELKLVHAEFVGTQECVSCHPAEYKAWRNSHHDQAMKTANDSTVEGDFGDVTFEHNGVSHKFFRKGEDFFVHTQDGTGEYKDFKVSYTFGVEPLQQYMVEMENGAIQCLQIAWDTDKGEWFDLQSDITVAPQEWLHWTRGAMRWNTMCADCHSTDLEKNFQEELDTYNTTYQEINVGCEGCHGPASDHVNHYKAEKSGTPPEFHMTNAMTKKELVDKCARCHSRRGQLTEKFDYHGTFLDHYVPSILTTNVYEMDGQIMDEDYVWGSFVQSKMYHNNVACNDCHDVHSLELKATGNTLCLQCHVPSYNLESHTFHKVDTEASQCVSCHMPGKTYMGNDFRRDHSFRVPRPDQSAKYGTPNACNGCHTDKSVEWAAEAIVKNYGADRPEHFSDLLLAGYDGNSEDLIELMNGQYPDIARATALNVFSQQISPDQVNRVTKFLRDSSALVRNEAVRLLSQLDDGSRLTLVKPLIDDDVRLVRIAAARYLSRLRPDEAGKSENAQAIQESMDAYQMQADFAGGQHALAIHYEEQGDISAAMTSYKKSLEIDDRYNQSRMNLAFLLYRQGDLLGAAAEYEKVTEIEPEFSYAYYMLGLLYNETGDNEKALANLDQATRTQPVNPKAFYNYALLLQQAQDFDKSLEVLARAETFLPMSEDLLYVKLIAEMNLQRAEARTTAAALMQLNPNNPQYRQIYQQLSQ